MNHIYLTYDYLPKHIAKDTGVPELSRSFEFNRAGIDKRRKSCSRRPQVKKTLLSSFAALICVLLIAGNSYAESANEALGTLNINLDYNRAGTIASNQVAVWIEDYKGALVKTLYVSRFTANGGYTFREEALPRWVEAANPASMKYSEIDAVSGATLTSGGATFAWDGTNAMGQPVVAGKYTFYVEGTLYWSSDVVYSGTFELGGASQKNIEIAVEYSKNPDTNADMLSNVRAEYTSEK